MFKFLSKPSASRYFIPGVTTASSIPLTLLHRKQSDVVSNLFQNCRPFCRLDVILGADGKLTVCEIQSFLSCGWDPGMASLAKEFLDKNTNNTIILINNEDIDSLSISIIRESETEKQLTKELRHYPSVKNPQFHCFSAEAIQNTDLLSKIKPSGETWIWVTDNATKVACFPSIAKTLLPLSQNPSIAIDCSSSTRSAVGTAMMNKALQRRLLADELSVRSVVINPTLISKDLRISDLLPGAEFVGLKPTAGRLSIGIQVVDCSAPTGPLPRVSELIERAYSDGAISTEFILEEFKLSIPGPENQQVLHRLYFFPTSIGPKIVSAIKRYSSEAQDSTGSEHLIINSGERISVDPQSLTITARQIRLLSDSIDAMSALDMEQSVTQMLLSDNRADIIRAISFLEHSMLRETTYNFQGRPMSKTIPAHVFKSLMTCVLKLGNTPADTSVRKCVAKLITDELTNLEKWIYAKSDFITLAKLLIELKDDLDLDKVTPKLQHLTKILDLVSDPESPAIVYLSLNLKRENSPPDQTVEDVAKLLQEKIREGLQLCSQHFNIKLEQSDKR